MLEGCTTWPTERAERYRRDGLWRGESLVRLLADAARVHGPKTALVGGGRRLNYAELESGARRMAAGFRARGIAPDDRVVVQLPNTPDFVVVCFALFLVGAKPVFALPAHRSNEIRHLCELSGAVGYVFPGVVRGFDFPALARQMREDVASLRYLFVQGGDGDGQDAAGPARGGDAPVPLAEVDADPAGGGDFPVPDPSDVAFFLLSGGTTALPKLIPRTHDDYAYQVRAAGEASGLTDRDVYLATLPVEFNFTWGCPGVVGVLRAGGTVVFAEDPTPEHCFPLIEREGVTMTSVVPSVVQLWLEGAEWLEDDLSSLRLLQIGSAKLHRETAEQIEPAFGCRLQQVFGMAEGLCTFTRDGDPAETVLTTQGRPISAADEIKIVDEEDRELPAGGIGELLTRGPYTLQGYYRAPEHNAKAFTPDGFYRTGDLARLTEDGDLVIEGRIKDVVIRGGDKVSAAEVEGHLLAQPGVARAAVIPVPDQFLGERICAYLVAAEGVEPPSLPELKQALHDRGLAEFKLPDRVVYVEDLPLTGLGKIDKKALGALARGEALPETGAFIPVGEAVAR
ncbi:putative 2,3-dihydroxybenzoate-AMP ligase [Actinacidiphila reveromycinica]|uniref:Putative 2,3-dihydroxybenzoate-AMP ligase n=1 Tax=Actinacidiphila reveromycinica TaxID=659352 RepID=A0A7U3VQS6_9ACTN|nr:AMP-binding protein [Streptomyces sp. SN-593]BBB00123.1 putative 2,3-dihydroxybenzoate-AMP ligase [Streptomyces sp. SN-593]